MLRPSGSDPDVELLVPEHDTAEPEVSIVVPALNEELTISDFVDWCKEGLRAAGTTGEILIVDSSTDRTPELALSLGARVLRTPRRGLGRAYIDALPFVRGRYVVMGDADCTYDFRRVAPFVEEMRRGNEFVMGSRWRGSIEDGSMPALHRYLGTPLTTWILNRIYGSHFTDIHCGMRGISRDALERMGLTSQSWEYASEMVLKSVRMNLATTEVPVAFYKDREGRLSHHKRSGWFSPFQAAWINLRAMFVYRPEFFALKPGAVLFVLGLLLTLPLSLGPITIGRTEFNLYWMLLGLTLSVLGLQSFFFGCLAQTFCDYTGRARRTVAPDLPLHALGHRQPRRDVRRGRAACRPPRLVPDPRRPAALATVGPRPLGGRRAPARHRRLLVVLLHAAAARNGRALRTEPLAATGAGGWPTGGAGGQTGKRARARRQASAPFACPSSGGPGIATTSWLTPPGGRLGSGRRWRSVAKRRRFRPRSRASAATGNVCPLSSEPMPRWQAPEPSIGVVPRYVGSMTALLPKEYSVYSPEALIQAA